MGSRNAVLYPYLLVYYLFIYARYVFLSMRVISIFSSILVLFIYFTSSTDWLLWQAIKIFIITIVYY